MDSSQYTPPVRRALSDEQIAEFVAKSHADEAGMLAAMQLLEEQVALRKNEDLEFEIWAVKMVQIGTPEALAALAAARGEVAPAPIVETPQPQPETQPQPEAPSAVDSNSSDAPRYVNDDEIIAALNDSYAAPIVSATPAMSASPVTAPQEDSTAEQPQIVPQADVVEEPTLAETAPKSIDALDDFELMLANGSVEDEVTAEQDHRDVAQPVSFTPHSSVALEEPIVLTSNSAFGQFWVWLALGAGVAPIALAWLIALAGASFLTSLLVGFGTILLGAFVVSTGALAGKRSGLSTLVVSRAAFGVHGNFIPATFVFLAKFIAAAIGLLLVISAFSLTLTTAGASLPASGSRIWSLDSASAIGLNWAFVYALGLILLVAPIAALGRRTLRISQISGGIASVVAFGFALVAVSEIVDFGALSWNFDTKNLLSLAGAGVLAFAIMVVLAGSAGADFADSLTRAARGKSVYGWVALSLVLIPTVVFGIALALIKSTSLLSFAMWVTSFDQRWLLVVAAVATLISLMSILAANLYSLRKAVTGLRLNWRPIPIVVVIGGLLVLSVSFVAQGTAIAAEATAQIATWAIPLLVVVVAWMGVLVSDILLRRIAYHEVSLNRAYGFYKAFNWVNLIGLAAAVAIGLGLVKPLGYGLDFAGYLLPLIGSVESAGAMQLGIVVAFFVGALWPVAFGIPRIKRQEVEIAAIESRRGELKDVFGVADF